MRSRSLSGGSGGGSNGGTSARTGTSENEYTVSSVANQLATPVKISDLGGLPELSGSTEDIKAATRRRNEMGKHLQNYVYTKRGTASPAITKNYINGTAEDRAAFVLKQAEQMTFGNSELLPEKIKSEIASQREFADRYSRFTEVITRHKSASWWTGQGSVPVARIAMQDYIDGKGWNEAILGKKK